MPFLVQDASGRYRLANTLAEALSTARQVAKASGRSSAIRAADVTPGDTLYYADANGSIRREAPRQKWPWE